MDKEFLKMRKDILLEIEIIKTKLARLNEIMDNLTKEKIPDIENRQGFIEICLKFINGEIGSDRVKSDLQKLNSQSGRKNEIILIDLEEIQKDLQRQLREKNESVRSIEKSLWRFEFKELKAELHEKTRSLLEKVAVAAINGGVPFDFNLIFLDVFGKFKRIPPPEEMRSIEIEVKKQWE